MKILAFFISVCIIYTVTTLFVLMGQAVITAVDKAKERKRRHQNRNCRKDTYWLMVPNIRNRLKILFTGKLNLGQMSIPSKPASKQ